MIMPAQKPTVLPVCPDAIPDLLKQRDQWIIWQAMKHPAIAFLRLLDPGPDAQFNIETYTDSQKARAKPKHDLLANRFPDLTIADIEERLVRLTGLNARGAGIFVAVNRFDGQRKKDNLSRVRGVHADFDGVDTAVLDEVCTILRPSIAVQTSSARNWHLYWLLTEGEVLDAAVAESINRGLVELGADPAAVDIARLLRMPGFKHMKNRGHSEMLDGQTPRSTPEVQLVSKGPRYSADVLKTAFRVSSSVYPASAASAVRISTIDDTPRQRARLNEMLTFISADCSYERYRSVVWAILSCGWDDVDDLAKAWCKTAPSRFDGNNFVALVNSHDPARTHTLGTLINLARVGGWNG